MNAGAPTSSFSRPLEDPRVRRTRRALQDALETLVEARAPITMTAIAQRAGLSRQVLHTHYDSVGLLASELLVRRMLEGTGHAMPAAGSPVTALVAAVQEAGLTPFLQFVKDDRDVFLVLRSLAHGQSAAILAQVFTGLLGTLPTAVRGEERALFAAGGMTALVDAWLRDEEAPTAEERAVRLERYARAVFHARP